MNFPLPKQKPFQENMVPLINIVFLLLIFFMIVGHIEPESLVEIPVSNSMQAEPTGESILILHAEGGISWQDKRYSMTGFASAVSEQEILSTGGKIIIRADQSRKANDFLRLLEILRSKNVKDVRLVTRQDIKS